MSSKIKNILFDFGGVILNIHHARVEKAFAGLSVKNFELLFNQATQSNLFQDFEKGLLSPGDFRQCLREFTMLNISDKILDDTWNEILGDYPKPRIELLKELVGEYRLFILSNTNEIHYQCYQDKFRENFGYGFNALFEETYWSFKFGKRKPEPDSFLHVVEESEILAEETLFIDDSLQNIESASQLGFNSYFLNPEEDITQLFDQGILKPGLSFFKR